MPHFIEVKFLNGVPTHVSIPAQVPVEVLDEKALEENADFERRFDRLKKMRP